MTDRGKLIELIEKGASEWWEENKDKAFRSGETNTEYIVDYLISKGVTIPVRCGECVKGFLKDKESILQFYWCSKWDNIMRPFDFCSFGKRREDE